MPNSDVSSNAKTSTRGRKTKDKKSNLVFFGLLCSAAVCVIAAIAVSLSSINTGSPGEDITNQNDNSVTAPVEIDDDKIHENIFVNGINIGGLTQEEAGEKLIKALNEPMLNEKLILRYDEEAYEYSFSEFNISLDISSAVKTAYSYGRNAQEVNGSVQLEAQVYYDEDILREIVIELSERISKEPMDASMERVDGQFVITDEQMGCEVDIDSTIYNADAILSSQKSGSGEIVVVITEPKFSAEAFRGATQLIGSYSTVISGSEANRNQNLDTAASKINDYVIYPGEVFSTNVAFGVMSYDNGYRMAPVIMGGELTNGMGGGVCQVSTTLYMALLYAEIEIVERQNHSQKVGYAGYGYDATLAGDYIDLKFRNDTDYPLTIEAYIESNKVFVNLYGYEIHKEGRRLEFYNVHTETVPAPKEKIIENSELPLGQRDIKTSAKDGVKYDLYKIVYDGNTEISREKVNSSYYRPRAAVVHVGTGEPVEPPAENQAQGEKTGDAATGDGTVEVIAQPEAPVESEVPVASEEPVQTEVPSSEPPLIEINPSEETPSTDKPPIID